MDLIQRSMKKNQHALKRIINNLIPVDGWKICSSCGKEWNRLTSKGICVECFDKGKYESH